MNPFQRTRLTFPLLTSFVGFAFSSTLLAMDENLRKDIADWLETQVRAEQVEPESYWSSLRELGARVGEETARELSAREDFVVEESVALMARDAALHPERVEALLAWYARPRREISREALGFLDDRLWAYHQREMEQLRHRSRIAEPLRDEHTETEYLRAWQACLLAPRDLPMAYLSERARSALSHPPHPSTGPLALEAARRLREAAGENGGSSGSGLDREASDYLDMIHHAPVASRARVLAGLEVVGMVADLWYVDRPDFTMAHLSDLRVRLALGLASRNIRNFAELREDPAKWADATFPHVLNERWRDYQAVIREMLEESESLELTEVDLEVLEMALSMMPDAPFPGGD